MECSLFLEQNWLSIKNFVGMKNLKKVILENQLANQIKLLFVKTFFVVFSKGNPANG
jgi:hypothetical protein